MARSNSRRIKVGGMEQLIIDIKPRRCDADVFLNTEVDVTKLVDYIESKKKKGNKYTYFHAFLLAFAKTIYNRPKLNRFIKNRHVYEHNDVVIAFVAKVAFEDTSEEIMIQIPVLPEDNIDSISIKIREKLDRIRNKKEEKKGANSAIVTLGKLPNIIRVPVVGLLKWMEEKGIMPKSLEEDDIYFSSAILTDIGVFKIGAIYHNNTNFGTCSSISAIGEIKEKEFIENGKRVVKKVVDFGINLDERIGDGFYFIKSFKVFQHILSNPKLLEARADESIKIPEN